MSPSPEDWDRHDAARVTRVTRVTRDQKYQPRHSLHQGWSLGEFLALWIASGIVLAFLIAVLVSVLR